MPNLDDISAEGATAPAADERVLIPNGVLTAAEGIAREALAEFAPRADVGEFVSFEALDEHTGLLRFATTRPGYPAWQWTVAVGRADAESELTVLEAELLPGEGALLAPEWLPWSERLAEYKAQQKLEAQARAEAGLDDDDSDDDEDLDDEDESILDDDDDDDDDDDSDDDVESDDDESDDDDSDGNKNDATASRGPGAEQGRQRARSRRSRTPGSSATSDGQNRSDGTEPVRADDASEPGGDDDTSDRGESAHALTGEQSEDGASAGRSDGKGASQPRRRRFWQRRNKG